MRFVLLVATLVVAWTTATGQAEERGPSRQKLNSLGLGSLKAASDHEGAQVRGGQFTFVIWTYQRQAGSLPPDNVAGNSLMWNGRPLSSDPATVDPVDITVNPGPVGDVFVNTNGQTVITSSNQRFRVVAGSSAAVLPLLPGFPGF